MESWDKKKNKKRGNFKKTKGKISKYLWKCDRIFKEDIKGFWGY